MPEWLDSWLLDPRTQNLLALASLIATIALGAAALWAPVRQLIEETFRLTAALVVNLLLIAGVVIICAVAIWLLLLPGRLLWVKLLVSVGLLVWALWPHRGGPSLRAMAAVAAMSWAVLAVQLSPPAPRAQPWQAAPTAEPTPPLVVPATPTRPLAGPTAPSAGTTAPTVGSLLIDGEGVALPTVTPGG